MTQHLARVLLSNVQQTILLVMAIPFAPFGIVCVGLAVTTVVRHLLARAEA